MTRKWQIGMTEIFELWLNDQPQTVYDAVLSSLKLLAINGPNLGRPHVDSVYDSAHSVTDHAKLIHKRSLKIDPSGIIPYIFVRGIYDNQGDICGYSCSLCTRAKH